MATDIATTGAPGRELTGRMVLLWLVGFFAIVGAANAVMIGAAISTFAGLEHDSPYQAGLAFDQEIAAARAQQALHWQVQAKVTRTDRGETLVEISAHDADGAPLSGLGVTASLVHPTDRRLDRELAMTADGPSQFSGVTGAAAGQWDVLIELSRDGARQFRSKNRVTLPR
ncbi:MAG TPA: FixH family protein [Xanthobacteraceae bacterium]|jgi:nitrogen fixation protein FixH